MGVYSHLPYLMYFLERIMADALKSVGSKSGR